MTITYKNISVFYTDQGSGEPIVLLHGFLENSTMWNELILEISKTHRVIALDLLGHGKTECLGYIHSMELMAQAVKAVLSYLKINKSILIGHSMGGYVALAYAEKHPNSLNGICLMNSTFLADDLARQNIRIRANNMAKTNFESLVHMSFTNLFSAESKNNYRNQLETALNEALKTPLQGYMAANEGMMIRKDRTQIFKNLRCKKLLIIGKKDPIVDGKILKDILKDSDVEIAEFSEGHMSHIENSKELTYKVMHFIE
ncbi:MAG: alpha/beta hydrolase [Xanthomarina sp.]